MKILFSSCCPRKIGGAFGYNPSFRVGTESGRVWQFGHFIVEHVAVRDRHDVDVNWLVDAFVCSCQKVCKNQPWSEKERVAGLQCDILILLFIYSILFWLIKAFNFCRFSVLLLPRSHAESQKTHSNVKKGAWPWPTVFSVLLSSSTKKHTSAHLLELPSLVKKLPQSNCVALIVHQTDAIMAVTCAECCSFWTVTTSVRLYKDSAAAKHFQLCHSLEEWRTGTEFPLEISGRYWQKDPLNATWL